MMREKREKTKRKYEMGKKEKRELIVMRIVIYYAKYGRILKLLM